MNDAISQTAQAECCVCHRGLSEPDSHALGGRLYCGEHHERALKASQAGWSRAGLIEVLLIGAFVAAVGLGFGAGAQAALPTSIGTGLLLALVPALVWMRYVHRQDRLEPEPLSLVLGVFVLGALLAQAVAAPLTESWFAPTEWQHRSLLAESIAAICAVACVQEACKYLAVRYTAYLTREFDEPVDGIVYSVAASLGMAVAFNIQFVVDSQADKASKLRNGCRNGCRGG